MKKSILSLVVLSVLFACGTPKNVTTTPTVNPNYSTVTMANMNPKISPQEDFFSFCNGTWVENTAIPSTESRWGSFNELETSNNIKLTEILEECKARPGIKGSQNQILGAYYASLLNMKVRDSIGITPISKD
jgi:putative endopeptidase